MAHVYPDLLGFADFVVSEAFNNARLSDADEGDDVRDDDISDGSDGEDDLSDVEGDGGEVDDGASEFGEEEWSGIESSIGDEMDQGAPELSAGLGAEASGGMLFSILPNVVNSGYTGARYYVPPNLRGVQLPQNQDSEVDIRLTKQLKGLLNRQGLVEITKWFGLLAIISG